MARTRRSLGWIFSASPILSTWQGKYGEEDNVGTGVKKARTPGSVGQLRSADRGSGDGPADWKWPNAAEGLADTRPLADARPDTLAAMFPAEHAFRRNGFNARSRSNFDG
jgi:hypothetical protein